jgi:hypothetical protein
MKMRHFLVIPSLALTLGLLAFSLQKVSGPKAPPTRPDISPPAPAAFDPSRKQEGGPLLRRAWEEMRLVDPATGRIPADIHRREQVFARSLPQHRNSALLEAADLDGLAKSDKINGWQYRGPWNIGGRTRALALDVSGFPPYNLLAGGVSGGMWRSTDDGASWTLTTGSSQLHSVTTIAQDTRAGHQNVWYYGTGEVRGNSAGLGGAPFQGDGLFKSTDGGQSWTPLPATSGNPPESFVSPWQYVWRVAVDASNLAEPEVYAANYGEINRSVDGGASFTSVLGDPSNSSRYTDVIVSSTGVVYASLSSDGGVSGIFRSTDGISWTDITPPGLTNHNRIVMGLAPSNENIMYCEVADINGTAADGFFKYTYLFGDGSGPGGFWEDRSAQMANLPGPGGGSVSLQTYSSYCMSVTVHPTDPDIVYLGGIHIYRSTDGFATGGNIDWVGGWQYTNHHADQHEFLFQPGSPVIAYTGSDGGVHKTLDATANTVNWIPLNNGYNTSQFYTVAIDENLPGSDIVIGGMQDNGTWFTDNLTSTAPWVEIFSGDGSYCAVADASGSVGTYLVSVQNGVIYRLTIDNSTGSWNTWTRIDPDGASNYLFINPFIMDPIDTEKIYLATNNGVWRNNDYNAIADWNNDPVTTNWDHLTFVPGNAAITALAVSRSTSRTLFYGSSNGRVYKLPHADLVPAGSAPTELYMGTAWSPGSYVSSIAIHPEDDQKVLLAVSNYNVVSLFYTENGGLTWTPQEGNLGGPDGPSVRTVAVVPFGGIDIFFAGTSTGLYSTYYLTGASTIWSLEAPALVGNVVVDMLTTRPVDGLVVAGTHGKGVYSIEIPAGSAAEEDLPQPARLAQNVPNPFNPMTTISFRLDRGGATTLTVFDVAGKRIKTLVDDDLEAGDHQYTWRGTDDRGRPVAAGVYLYRLDSGTTREVKRMTLVR